ncbi:MAG: restriction endonuclease subunit S [Bryobacteraceae bacterium]|jgi:type I restriction enzyme S subunit
MIWRHLPLHEVAPPVASEVQFAPEDAVWHLTLDQIESHTGRIINKRMAVAADAGNSTFTFDSGNVLYSKLRPYLNKVVLPREPGIATTELVPLRPIPGVLLSDFLVHYLRSPGFLGFAQSCVAGAKMPRVIMSQFWEKSIPLPPPSEQRRIAEILGQADALRRKRAEADALADRIPRALFLKMFGDPLTNPHGWAVRQFGDPEVGVLDRGRSQHRPRNAPQLYGGPYPFVQTGDVANSGGVVRRHTQTYSDAGLAQSRLWPAGTLCVTIAANIAKTGILTFDACFPDSVVGFIPGKAVTTEYVQTWLTFVERRLEELAPQMAQKNINLEILRNLPIPVPPSEAQRDFSRRIVVTQEIRNCGEVSEAKLTELFDALMNQAFDGTLTAKWRAAHIKELLAETEHQTRLLGGSRMQPA